MLKLNGAVALISCALIMSGCSQQSVQKASNDISSGLQSANNAANQVGKEVKPSLQKLDLGARVTAALRANANLPDTIRVDASTSGVRLRGKVDTSAQKSLAGKIAKATLPPNKSVDNELKVTSG
jgi:osmotically-inducible protein OsmY